MYVLGISSFSHESSCALLKNGNILAIGEEERFNREKHTSKYPKNAIEYCLKTAGISIQDIDHITFFWQPRREVYGNIKHVLRYFPKSLNLLRTSSGGGDFTFFERIRAKENIGKLIQSQFNLPKSPHIHFIEHHLCHAASSFFVSEFEDSAILTIDGRGESTATMISAGHKNKIKKLKEVKVPHSLGHLYAAITHYLGFKPFFDEWKVMGLSAYGKDTLCSEFDKLIEFYPNGEYRLNLDYFSFHTHGGGAWLNQKFFKIFGPKRTKEDPYTEHHSNIAYALQKVVEKAGVHLARHAYEITGLSNLCMTGGVVLNCLMNKKVIEQTQFKNFFFQPIANDAGTSLGSALYLYHHILGGDRKFVFDHVYWGPEYTNFEIENVLIQKNVNYIKCQNIAAETAKHIAQGKIVGWFQGRMECGPRALGNRSITVDPTLPDMKDRLNARVKRREGFRPFAPSILEEHLTDYFSMPKKILSPYMILVGDVLEKKRHLIPAVTHVDNTARVHSVSRKINPRYWELIHEFNKIKGVPVLLNTSFNENEPIVCTPADAVDCFLRTEFDVLSIGDFLVTKESYKTS